MAAYETCAVQHLLLGFAGLLLLTVQRQHCTAGVYVWLPGFMDASACYQHHQSAGTICFLLTWLMIGAYDEESAAAAGTSRCIPCLAGL
jgi:hypothetical protein